MRTPMPWCDGPGGGFTRPGVPPWLPLADPAACNVADQVADLNSPGLHPARHRRPAASDDLAVGSYRSLSSPAGTWTYSRGAGGTVVASTCRAQPLEGVTGTVVRGH